jgi:fibronectin type 3 domain-containing protein
LAALLVCAPLLAATAFAATGPAKPTGLTATSPTRTAPVLKWNPAAGATAGYRVYRGGTQIASTTALTYTDNGLKTSGSYSYTVRSVANGNKLSSPSSAVTVIYDTIAPSAVSSISAVTPTASAPVLSWSPATDTGGSGVRRYEVFRDGASRGFTSTAGFTDTGAPDGSYAYTVVTEDGAGNRSPASAARTVVVDTTPPSVPGTPQPAQADTGAAPALSWAAATDAGTGVAGYKVMRDGTQIGTTQTTSFTDTGVAASGSYSYTVSAYDALGTTSAPSAAATVTYDATPPAAPTGLAAQSPAADPQLTWNAVTDDSSGAITYRISRDGQPIDTASSTGYTDTAAAEGSHSYTVAAVDRFGRRSAESAAVTVVVDTTPPSMPLGVFAYASGGAAAVSWAQSTDSGTGVASYEVRRGGSSLGTVTGTVFRDGGGGSGSVYAVRAVDAAGNTSPWSSDTTASAPFPAGVASRQVTDDSRPEYAAHPQLGVISVMLRWFQIQPDATTYNWGNLDASLADATANHYRVVIRIMCGGDAPQWMATTSDHPVPFLDLISTDPSNDRWPGEMLVPVPWSPNLAYHYADLMTALNAHLSQPDGAGGTWADHVEFVPIAMPTVLGTEMQVGYGSGTYTGYYKGVYGTYDRAATNQTEWLAHASSGTTNADKLQSNRNDIESAWHNAIQLQLSNLKVVPSAIAYGPLFNDAYASAQRLAASESAAHGDRLWSMTTNLQPKVNADGSLGPYSQWSAPAAQTMQIALQSGAVIGFQTAGNGIINTAAKMREVINDGISNYNMRFLETSPEAVDAFPDLLLTNSDSAQNQLVQRFGG